MPAAPSPRIIPTLRPNDLCSAAFFGDFARVKELLFVEPVDEDPPLEPDESFDPMQPADDEAEAENAERQAQRDANRAEVLKKLAEPGLLTSRKTAVDVTVCGLGVEVLPTPGGGVRSVFVPREDCAPANKASPLHWAVLAREHDVVAFLIAQGADPNARDATFAVSPLDVCKCNRLHETARVVAVAAEAAAEKQEAEAAAKAARKAVLERRAAAREEAHRKAREEEDRDAAAAAAGDDDGAGGAGDDGDDGY